MKKIINFIKGHKRLFIFLGVIFLIGLIVFVIIFLQSRKPKEEIGTTPPPATVEPFNQVLAPPQIFPRPGTVEMANTKNSISLNFSEVVETKSVKVSASPAIDFNVTSLPDAPLRVILEPKTAWQNNTTYKIRILKGITATLTPATTDKDILIEYTTILPQNPRFGVE